MPDCRLIHGDCLEKMADIESGSVDMVFTSPPYNLGDHRGGYPENGLWKKSATGIGGGYNTHSDDMKREDYVRWQNEILLACFGLLSEEGAIFYNHKPRVVDGVLQTPLDLIPDSLRCNVRQIVIWNRRRGYNFSQSFYLPSHEWILIIAKEAWRLKDKSASGAMDVWDIPPEVNTPHPAPFPLALPSIAIQSTTAQTVLDPFMGSGTTGVACANLKRNFIGIELDADYLKIAKRRIEDANNTLF